MPKSYIRVRLVIMSHSLFSLWKNINVWADLGAALVVAALDVVLELVGLCGEDVGLLVRTVVGAVELHSAPVLHQRGGEITESEIILGRHFLKSTQKGGRAVQFCKFLKNLYFDFRLN